MAEADVGEPELDVPPTRLRFDLADINGNPGFSAISKLSPANNRLPNSDCE
jgi:hypothetical protein